MDLMTREDLHKLLETENDKVVSIYMPTFRMSLETKQNPIRFKNLVHRAEEEIRSAHGRDLSQAFADATGRLLRQESFWQHQADGLAAFYSAGNLFYYRLPISFEERAVVSDRFHIKPLLPLFAADGKFFLLALSQNEVRVFQCTVQHIDELQVEGIPESLGEALKYDLFESQLQFRSETGEMAGPGRRAAIFHGHGVGIDETKDNILRFFQQVDEGLRNLLADEQAPLVLAGVEYLFPIYRQASSYRNILSQGIPGNPETLSAKDLHRRARKIAAPVLREAYQEAASRYEQLAGTGKASADLKEIVPAARQGKVDVLFAATGVEIRGAFDPERNAVEIHGEKKPGSRDLIDDTAVHTLAGSGAVYAFRSADGVPGGTPVAAIFRY